MSGGDFAGGGGPEFEPATPPQIEHIALLTSQALDGAVALASRRQMFTAEYFESEFFHQWLARYVHDGAVMEPVDAEEADTLLCDPAQSVTAFPEKVRHNQVGMAIGLASGIAYDGGYLEFSAPITGSDVSYDIRYDALLADTDRFVEQLYERPRDADEAQARVLLDIAKLVALLDETGSPAPLERMTSINIRERFHDFPLGEEGDGVTPETAAALKSRLLAVVEQRSIRATFLRRFQGGSGKTNATLEVKLDGDGKYSRRYELQVRTPTTMAGFDEYVTKLEWHDDDGDSLKHVEYFDVDINELIARKEAEDPEFELSRSGMSLINEAMRTRKEQQQIFEEERAQGWHMFSQAGANAIIRALEDPGELTAD